MTGSLSDRENAKGSLLVVGTGIMLAAQVTVEAIGAIREADIVFYVVPDLTKEWLHSLNGNAHSLAVAYEHGKRREESYREMAERIMAEVRRDLRVCAVFYGHPGVFVDPSHRAIKMARAEGYDAQMLPGVSAEDCLFADLGIDPSVSGCHSYEATDFLVKRRRCDPSALLILWQVGALGELSVQRMQTPERMRVLADVLLETYPADHEVVLYVAARYPTELPGIERMALADLGGVVASSLATLVVPAATRAVADPAMAERLNIVEPLKLA